MDKKIYSKISDDPFARSLGVVIDEVGEGFAQVSMTVSREMLNIHSTANGGVIFSLADIAFAIASNTYEQDAVGVNVNINYIASVQLGEQLTANAKEVSKNPRLGFYRMEVKNKEGELVAAADGMVYRKKKRAQNH